MQQPLTEIINDLIYDRPEILLASLGIEEKVLCNRLSISCPVHSGDNPQGVTLYFNEYNGYKGRWVCWTGGCEKTFKRSLIGFCRGVLSVRHCRWSRPGDKIFSWGETLKYLCSIYGINSNYSFIKKDTDRDNFISICQSPTEKKDRFIMTKDYYLKVNSTPSEYFRERGFSDEVLRKYGVYSCVNPTKPFYRRSLIPVFNGDNLIGISARSECNEEPKYKYTKGFPSATSLYNIGFASEYIRKSRTCVITESPTCVWRLEEVGIHNGVAIWSALAWNDCKQRLLDKLGVMKLVLALDNDSAGQAGRQKIREAAGRFYNIVDIVLPDSVNDLADMTVEQVKELFL